MFRGEVVRVETVTGRRRGRRAGRAERQRCSRRRDSTRLAGAPRHASGTNATAAAAVACTVGSGVVSDRLSATSVRYSRRLGSEPRTLWRHIDSGAGFAEPDPDWQLHRAGTAARLV